MFSPGIWWSGLRVKGIVNLLGCRVCVQMAARPYASCCHLDACFLPPHEEGLGASTPILSRGHQIAPWTEVTVDHRVGR